VQAYPNNENTQESRFGHSRPGFWPILFTLSLHVLAIFVMLQTPMLEYRAPSSNSTLVMISVKPSGTPDVSVSKSKLENLTDETRQAHKLAGQIPAKVALPKPENTLGNPPSASIEADDKKSDRSNMSLPDKPNTLNLRDQARLIAQDMARLERDNQAAPSISGGYYGTYDGDDTGTFYFSLDRYGNVFGSGMSRIARSNFSITGKVSAEGVIQLQGKGLAGTASFEGRIHANSGVVSGTWYLAKFGRGKFSGKRE
jgi:hypothetical protein